MRDDWKKFEGQVVNKMFTLQAFLGSTSHSAVFATQSPPPQAKNLAIKFVSAGARADAHVSLLQRASLLSHPNILRLLPGGRCRLADMDLIFMLMEYAEEDLGQILPAHPLPAARTREMLGLLLGALSHLHTKNFAHTHIKPSNIMSISKQLKLSCDVVQPFGETRHGYRQLDAYDAPEAGTALVAPSSDMWSLGMTLVETLTQQLAAPSQDGQSDPVAPPSLPQPFLEIAQQCLRRDPRQRWTMAQVAHCLNPAPVEVAAVEAAASASASVSAQKAAPAPAVAPEGKTTDPTSEAWQDIYYTWVVLCRNYFFHMRQNLFFRHRIPLAYTDPFAPVPEIEGPFEVRCDDCGKTYVYKRKDLRRYEGEVPKFNTHPLF